MNEDIIRLKRDLGKLNDDNSGVTAFIMDKNLDTGDIIHQKYFQKPSHQYLDEVYDSYIRSETLIELLTTKEIPFYNLKKLHKVIQDQMPSPKRGIVDAYKDIIPTIFKQSKDKNYFIILFYYYH